MFRPSLIPFCTESFNLSIHPQPLTLNMAFIEATKSRGSKEADDEEIAVQRCLHVFACMSNYVQRYPKDAQALFDVIQAAVFDAVDENKSPLSSSFDENDISSETEASISTEQERDPEPSAVSTDATPNRTPPWTRIYNRGQNWDTEKPTSPGFHWADPGYYYPFKHISFNPTKRETFNPMNQGYGWNNPADTYPFKNIQQPLVNVYHANTHQTYSNLDLSLRGGTSSFGRTVSSPAHYPARHNWTQPPTINYNPLLDALNPTAQLYDLVPRNSTLTILAKNNKIANLILQPIPRHELRVREGRIYAWHITLPQPADEPIEAINIGGISSTTPDQQITQLANRFKWENVSSHLQPLWDVTIQTGLERYKELVQYSFWNERRAHKGRFGTGKYREHKEWFLVDGERAEVVARMWADFADLRPYDEGTGELKDEWKGRLQGLSMADLETEGCWSGFVYEARRQEAEAALVSDPGVGGLAGAGDGGRGGGGEGADSGYFEREG